MIWIWRRIFFFSFIPREKHSKYEKTIFYPDIGEKKFFFGQTWEKIMPQLSRYIDLLGKQIFFSNIKFCTLFRKTLNFCISLILEKKERRIYAESYAYNMYIPTYVYVLFFMSAYMPEVSLSFITMWMNLKVRCPLQDVSDMSKLKWEHLKMKMFSGSAERWRYSIRLFSKMSDKREGGVKNLKKWVTF